MHPSDVLVSLSGVVLIVGLVRRSSGRRPAVPPAGWYPDAERPGGMRYWDGRAWTEHRA